jgi:short-subunit dehydrogenase
VQVALDSRKYVPVHELEEDDWQAVLDLDLSATYRTICHLALELGPHGIRVNTVNPATTRSERMDATVPAARPGRTVAARPVGYPSGVVNATLYLASDAAGWITGVSLDVAGGRVSPSASYRTVAATTRRAAAP